MPLHRHRGENRSSPLGEEEDVAANNGARRPAQARAGAPLPPPRAPSCSSTVTGVGAPLRPPPWPAQVDRKLPIRSSGGRGAVPSQSPAPAPAISLVSTRHLRRRPERTLFCVWFRPMREIGPQCGLSVGRWFWGGKALCRTHFGYKSRGWRQSKYS